MDDGKNIMNFPLFLYYSLSSTMDQARTLIGQGQLSGLVVAYTQTQGHGRFNRPWISPEGNFYGTFFLKRPQIEGALSLHVAAHLFKKLEPYSGGLLKFKWPNDLLLGGAKVSGILLERMDDFLLVGMGINLKSSPQNIDQPTACLFDDPGITIELAQFCDVIKAGFLESLNAPFSTVRDFCLGRMWGLNSPCRVKISASETVEGICKGIDPTGALLVEVEGGQIKTIRAGDLEFDL